MTDYSIIELELRETVGISKRPVAVTFLASPPQGVPKFAGRVPSGCSFFGIASGGMTFYTVPADHYNCAIGCYSCNLPLPPGHAEELEKSLRSLGDSGSIQMDAIHSVTRTAENPYTVVYSPLGDTPIEPDIAVLVVRPLQAMFLQEAALRRGIGLQIAPFGKPTCMLLHDVLKETAVTSAGCMGNRVYNALNDDEFYMMIPAQLLNKITDEIQLIATANKKLAEYYLQQRSVLETIID
jgi:uncharacterized protein (DUF169 family)